MGRRSVLRRWVSALFVVGALTAVTIAPAASASTSNAKVIAGMVDVNTNLGYENAAAAGTGMVLSSAGEVLTNNHVIEGATTIKVRDVGNGRTYNASVVGYDVAADVAVVQLKGASKLKTVPIGSSSAVKVGAKVTAIGNAGGTGGTPSSASGTVAALDQSITASDELNGTSEQLTGLIETNAAIEPGDSGGPLVNAAGDVIAMVTAGSSGFEFQRGAGEGFAIPINTATALARQMESGRFSGNVHRGATAFLGVESRRRATSGVARSSPARSWSRSFRPHPAEEAGLVAGDAITSFAGQSVTSPTQLTHLLLARAPGAKVQLGWVDRYGTTHRATVTLASGPPQ